MLIQAIKMLRVLGLGDVWGRFMMILQRMESGLSAGLLPAGCSLVISLVGFWQGITVLMCCRDMSGCFCGIHHQLKLIF